jgi:hypothetical protein
MGVEIAIIVVMLALLVYWHICNPESKAVTLGYERELLSRDAEI